MAGPIAPDTPDYQRGVVSAQLLLLPLSAVTGAVFVDVPPNAETMIVILDGAIPPSIEVIASTVIPSLPLSGTPLAVFPGQPPNTWFFDVTSVYNGQVVIRTIPIGGFSMSVYADAGVHVMADASNLKTFGGSQYVVPVVPSTAASDHPPTELVSVSGRSATGGLVVAGAGSGKRVRVFYCTVSNDSASALVTLNDSISGGNVITSGGGAAPGSDVTAVDFKPSGLPLSASAGITANSTAGLITFNIVFTVETI